MTTGSDVILTRLMTLHPKIIDLTLDRMWRLLKALGNPQDKLPPVIHVAGTNGKGSTVAMVRAGLEAAGKRCHVYTSPHLVRFHERIRLAGELIDEDALMAALDECEAANGGESITYFEITTCAALLAMSRVPADYTLLEVGLGGRLDATNVIKPIMTAITPVSMDHEQFLGDTVAKIAGEKAGIIKRGVPCIVAPQLAPAEETIEATAMRLGAPLLVHGQHWHVRSEAGRLVFEDDSGLLDLPLPALPGAHQVMNAGTALAILRAVNAGEAAYNGAMTDAEWPARLQRLRDGRIPDRARGAEFWLDGGHNPSAGAALADHVATLPDRPTQIICGMLRTKDARGFLRPLAGVAERLFAVPIPGEANTLPAEETADMAREVGHTATAAESFDTALQAALSEHPDGRILICGSLYLAGHVLRVNAE